MVTKRYAHILDEDRRTIASQMEERFYHNAGNIDPTEQLEKKPLTALPISKLAAEKCLLQRFTFSHERLWHGNLLADFISKKIDHLFIARQKESRKP